jgi:Skp family chaperone for outer membrane proteins
MRYRCFSLLAATLALAISTTAYAQGKIAVVDLEKLIRLHPNTADDKKQLENTLKDYNRQKEQLKALAASTAKAFEAAYLEAKNPALSEAARKKAEDAAIEKRKAALEADRNASEKIRELQRDLNAQELKMLRRTSDVIEAAIGEYAKETGIDLVLQLPSKLGPGSGIVYSKPEMDITAEIMKRLGIEDKEPAEDEEAAEDKAPSGGK